jgi:hypothetical protein
VCIIDTERQFEYPKEFDLNTWWKNELVEFGHGNIEVILKVRDQSAIDEWMKNDTVKTMGDGILTVKYYVDKWNGLILTILHYGDSVIVGCFFNIEKQI